MLSRQRTWSSFLLNPWSERCLLHLKLLYYLIQVLSFFHSSKYQKKYKKKLQLSNQVNVVFTIFLGGILVQIQLDETACKFVKDWKVLWLYHVHKSVEVIFSLFFPIFLKAMCICMVLPPPKVKLQVVFCLYQNKGPNFCEQNVTWCAKFVLTFIWCQYCVINWVWRLKLKSHSFF